ncbi:Alpha/Beta hydrolase protein [Mrakia frigida]|uniref:alpha/beta hydrolase n=1 Tax=Mrakia frigida TaxID=29902 RepID=UPI003FCBF4D4
MPKVLIHPSAGPFSVNYTISTPSSSSSTHIDAALPTLLLLHGGLIPSETWTPQVLNVDLRRFNLVLMDCRKHGGSEGGDVETFSFEDSMDDVFHFMEALALPPCFLSGLSLGASTALHFSLHHPSRVLGLVLISPLPWIEIEAVSSGRRELVEVWGLAMSTGNKELLPHVANGAAQMGMDNVSNPFIDALLECSITYGIAQWSSPKQITSLKAISYDLLVSRGRIGRDALAKITSPILLIFASADSAYPLPLIEEVQRDLVDAGLEVDLKVVDGASHFANCTQPEAVSALLFDFVRKRATLPLFDGSPDVSSPFLSTLSPKYLDFEEDP